MNNRIIVILSIAVFIFPNLIGQDVIGKWKHYDEKTKLPNTIIETYIENDKLYGKIIVIFNYDKPDTLKCVDCPGSWNNKKILGLNVVNGLTKEDNCWVGDQALIDPETGEVYDCKIWFEDGNLKVRGYVGFLFQTIDWFPLENESQTAKITLNQEINNNSR